ncbi:MAG: type II toxin-antitoxin system RelE/ParE family toxin [Pirellulaceae bacterium]
MVELRKYRNVQGQVPFDEWFSALRDRRAQRRIQVRIDRLAVGLEGDWKSVGEGVRELRVPEGSGHRVYYAWDGDALVLLLCGGDKSTQSSDIAKAREFSRDYHGQ